MPWRSREGPQPGNAPLQPRNAGLDEGAVFAQDGLLFPITYQGGPDGNGAVLTRVG
jgi:hypothetical protein